MQCRHGCQWFVSLKVAGLLYTQRSMYYGSCPFFFQVRATPYKHLCTLRILKEDSFISIILIDE